MSFFMVLAIAARLSSAVLYPETSVNNHTCAIQDSNSVLSCSAKAVPGVSDSCCVETFGGLLLFTQFWNTYTGLEDQGQLLPESTWTLHGLWPDFCNGSYTQYCDLTRQYDRFPSPNVTNWPAPNTQVPAYNGSSIAEFVKDFGRDDLLEYMNTYWVAQGQPSYEFWEHEFANPLLWTKVPEKSGSAIMYYRRTPTWQWLNSAGIVPSNTTAYSLKSIQTALTSSYGALPYIACSGPRYNETAAGSGSLDNGRTVLSEAWYYAHAYGRPQDGNTVPLNATGSVTSCASTPGAVWYYEPSVKSVRKAVLDGIEL
ncbi:hypothetical protein PpBr36_07777 [Pyricularia pennisetigena]|uniref:hypothetical protein n=1 Tax=Pyricularia pennisetigena TaxID=1578925 RepID=UPI001151B62F|nr:hypothetical protein PpBr36_07777 [Pyricularia pennisetigena]TLS25398.1 hypothetical protein PpBr36_07777 [Pyricularia pennisetigena]